MGQTRQVDGDAVNRNDGALLRRFGVRVTSDRAEELAAYRRRVRRARWYGALAGLGAFATSEHGHTDRPVALVVTFVVLGYVLASCLVEVSRQALRSAP